MVKQGPLWIRSLFCRPTLTPNLTELEPSWDNPQKIFTRDKWSPSFQRHDSRTMQSCLSLSKPLAIFYSLTVFHSHRWAPILCKKQPSCWISSFPGYFLSFMEKGIIGSMKLSLRIVGKRCSWATKSVPDSDETHVSSSEPISMLFNFLPFHLSYQWAISEYVLLGRPPEFPNHTHACYFY